MLPSKQQCTRAARDCCKRWVGCGALSGRALHLPLLLVLLLSFNHLRAGDLETLFRNPPESARPWTFWYWMNGAVSKEGVTADLEAMKRIGLAGAYLVPIKDVPNPPLYQPSIRTMTPEWWAMLRHAFSEADRLGLKLAMHGSDGFATAGGSWNTPELSMQKVVWTEQQFDGGRTIDEKLSQPTAYKGYYRDIATLAFPAPEGAGISTRTVTPKVTTSVAGFDASTLIEPGNTKRIRSEEPCWVQYEFQQPFTCRSIVVRSDGANYAAIRPIVEVSDDGKNFRSLGRLETPRHGWQDGDAVYTFSIKPTTARFFRIVHDPAGAEPGAEDLDSAKWRNVFKVQSIELFSAAQIPNYEGKSGLVWRRSTWADASLIPDELCVPRGKIIDITDKVSADGQLHWQAPIGKWTILRVGYTSTGHENNTAGASKGLECDRFNPVAVRLQFDRWFGETIKQVGPELAARVLKVFHIDSWEAGSQNWSPVFREEFKKRRGYDLTSYLPVFAGIPVESADASERFLHDVRQTITDLTNDVFFSTLSSLAKEHGCEFTAEATAATMMGDGMRHFGIVDVPAGEFWLRSPAQDKPNDVNDAISGAHVYGKQIVMSEAFTERNLEWDEYPGMLKALGDHNYALGVNRLLLHVFVHNPWLDRKPGMTLSNIGVFFNRDQTWFEPARAWINYLTRCQALLQHGKSVTDVVYFTGEELPSRALLPERYVPSLPDGYKADSINRDALLRLAKVHDGRIELPGGASYAVLVLPPGKELSSELLTKIEELEKAGATIIRAARNDNLSEALTKKQIAVDLIASDGTGHAATGIEWTHRTSADGDIYFISNQNDWPCTTALFLRVAGVSPQLFEPVTGEVAAVQRSSGSASRTELKVQLQAHGSVFIVFSKDKSEKLPSTANLKPVFNFEGAWRVQFDPRKGGPYDPVEFQRLTSWSEHENSAIRFFSGTACYTKTFEWAPPSNSERVLLSLGTVANIAEIKVNGVDCGVAWTPPYQVDITKAIKSGSNTLEIRVTNTWKNRLVGDRDLPAEKRITWTTANPISAKAGLLPAGLFGPVSILSETTLP